MAYIDGFVIPVPTFKRANYLALAKMAAPIFMEHGALRVVECWGDDVAKGKLNDFRTAVLAEEGESVVFSWIEWPSKEARDAGNAAALADPRMAVQDMPFSGARMIFSGFSVMVDTAARPWATVK
jgi:uncharacterized protein YbaA (DUF1428 family)